MSAAKQTEAMVAKGAQARHEMWCLNLDEAVGCKYPCKGPSHADRAIAKTIVSAIRKGWGAPVGEAS